MKRFLLAVWHWLESPVKRVELARNSLFVTVILLIIGAIFAQQQNFPGGGTNTFATAGINTPIDPKSFGITFDGRGCFGAHVTWTNASHTITGDATCQFTSADNNKKAFGSPCAGGVTTCVGIGATLPIGTVTFVNATTLTTTATTTGACPGTGAGCQMWIFTDNRPQWCCGAGTVDNAIQTATGCVTLLIPAGFSPLPFGFGNTASPTCAPNSGGSGTGTQLGNMDAGNYAFGLGIGSSGFIFPPDNNFTNCTGNSQGQANAGCVFSGIHGGSNFSITGGGNCATGSHNAVLFGPPIFSNFFENISLQQFGCSDTGNLVGYAVPFSNKNDGIYVDEFGGGTGGAGAACLFNGVNVIMTNSFCGDVSGFPVLINGSSTVARTGNFYIGASIGTIGVQVSSGATWWSKQDQSYGSVGSGGAHIFIANGGEAHMDSWYNASGSAYGIVLQPTAKLYLRDSHPINGSTHCIGTQGATMTTGAFFDEGANVCTGAAIESTLVPTCAMTTGGGTGPACALVAGSTNEKGTIRMTPGTTPGATGTTTLTFSGTFSGSVPTTPSCTFSYANTGTGTWSLTTTTPIVMTTRSTTAPVINWNQTGALTAASTYDIDYVCVAR